MFLLRYYNDEIIIKLKHYFYMDEKLFELFFIENDFAKYFAIHLNILFHTLW